jgi:hypothetical protein
MTRMTGILINCMEKMLCLGFFHSCCDLQEHNTNVKRRLTVHGDTLLFDIMLV